MTPEEDDLHRPRWSPTADIDKTSIAERRPRGTPAAFAKSLAMMINPWRRVVPRPTWLRPCRPCHSARRYPTSDANRRRHDPNALRP